MGLKRKNKEKKWMPKRKKNKKNCITLQQKRNEVIYTKQL